MIKELGRIVGKRAEKKYLMFTVFSMIGSFLNTLCVSVVLPYITVLTDINNLEDSGLAKYIPEALIRNPEKLLVVSSALVLFVYIIKNLYLYILDISRKKFVLKEYLIRLEELFNIYLARSYKYYLNHDAVDIANSLNEYLGRVYDLIGIITSLISEAAYLIMLIILLCVSNIKITLYFTLFYLVYLLANRRVFKKQLEGLGDISNSVYNGMTKIILETISGIQEIKLMSREKAVTKQLNALSYKNYDAEIKKATIQNIPKIILELGSITILLGIVLSEKHSGGTGFSIAKISTAVLCLMRIMPTVNSINKSLSGINYLRPSLDIVSKAFFDDIEATEPEKTEKISFEKAVRVSNMSFSYTKGRTVLENINLSIPKGSTIGIRGVSGGGKTTLANIILGLLQPDSGAVLCDDHNIMDNRTDWFSKLSYIPQNIFLLNGSIRDNIVFMREVSEEEVWAALEKVQMRKFVEELENGLDTTIGDRGIRLSGGQRQRIGIARAICRKSEIFIFDEPTASLDGKLEEEIMDTIYGIENRTVIIIAHRLNTLKKCDTIYEVRGKGLYKAD